MKKLLFALAFRLWPELRDLNPHRQLVGIGDVFTTLYGSAAAVAGITWLVLESNWALARQEWLMFLVLGAFIVVFNRLSFFLIVEFRADRYGSSDGSFDSMMVWAGALLFGPTTLWLMVVYQLAVLLLNWPQLNTSAGRWNQARSTAISIAGFTLPFLVGLVAYQAWGGAIPIRGLLIEDMLIGLGAIAINFSVFFLLWLPYLYYALWTQKQLAGPDETRPIVVFFLLTLILPTLAHPFAVLAAGLFTQVGAHAFFFLIAGLVVVAYVTRQFSWAAESNRQHRRQLEKLEQLGRAILAAPPDASNLPQILQEHLPNMFPSNLMAVSLLPDTVLFKAPEDWDKDFRPIWAWMITQSAARAFLDYEPRPWLEEPGPHRPAITVPILAHESNEVIGGIYLELRHLAQPWDRRSLEALFPGIHALADQIRTAIHKAEEYAQSLAYEKVSQELRLAGQIQASFLPNEFPNIPGWQLAVSLEPAGGLSGDFFDLIPLSGGKLGLVIADVADKGLGAALYMALSRTLLRTYALEYPSRPDIVLSEANERILGDARANLFITAFYGVLDPAQGTLTYCNAGHNPPFLVSLDPDAEPLPLNATGMPIGIEKDAEWERETLQIKPGCTLILYTDGVIDAQNGDGAFFDDNLLLEAALENLDCSAYEMQANILNQLRSFVGATPQFDDITLMILSREREPMAEQNPQKESGG